MLLMRQCYCSVRVNFLVISVKLKLNLSAVPSEFTAKLSVITLPFDAVNTELFVEGANE